MASLKRALCRALAWPLERLIGLGELDRIYQTLPQTQDLDLFLSECMRAYGFSYRLSDEALSRIPASGPLMVVCNHHYGGIEGVILAHLLRRVRPDVKLMANAGLLGRIAELREAFIFVDPFGSSQALRSNLGPLKQCLAWLKQGKALGVFPAGEVASLRPIRAELPNRSGADVAKLALKAGASLLPLYFEGANGPLFHCLGLLHPRLLMLARELVNKRSKCVNIHIGNPIPAERLLKFGQNAAAHLRLRTLMLGEQD